MAELPETLDRYRRQLPYEVLGVAPDASAREISDRHNELQRDLQEAKMSASERTKESQRLEGAYNQLRTAGNRVRIDFFVLDSKLGVKQCEAAAKALTKPNTDVQGIIKPRRVRVTHEALMDDLKGFVGEPERVVGLHLQPIELAAPPSLPEPLAIQFDC